MENINHSKNTSKGALIALMSGLLLGATSAGPVATSTPTPPPAAADWTQHTVNPVSDPILFEDALIRTEIRPAFGYQHLGSDFFGGGDLQIYGIQLRYAVTDRLAIVGNKGGYMEVHPNLGPDLNGWADLGIGLKYALIDDRANAFILTPGVLFQIPTGSKEIFQGRGSGIWDIFVSAEKGFGNFHLLGNIGVLAPNDTSANSTMLHYHLQADYYACRWFKPFIVGNGYTVLSSGSSTPLNSEGYDLVNFGSIFAGHSTQITLGGGFRTELAKNLELGFCYEKAVSSVKGLLDDRYTVDLVFHF